ncbi:MAG TPA: YbdD/YjiX family protein [Steroidobacteraceae bacterium]|nr:YbdD/YjiX family protein [Steroidobacteraceae bacterium]
MSDDPAAADAPTVAAAGAPPQSKTEPLPARAQAIRQTCRRLLGIPDYDGYLAHRQQQHPGQAVLSEREFHAEAIDRKYGAAGPRCC